MPHCRKGSQVEKRKDEQSLKQSPVAKADTYTQS
jgi:hypothetical protein